MFFCIGTIPYSISKLWLIVALLSWILYRTIIIIILIFPNPVHHFSFLLLVTTLAPFHCGGQATFMCQHEPQFEIMLKNNEADISQFDFLQLHHYLNPCQS